MADRDSERAQSMQRCRQIANSIKEVYGEAKTADGLAVKALKGHVKKRSLEKKIAAIPAEFDLDESSQYDSLCLAAEAFKDTPMGEHLAEQAEQMRNGSAGDGERPDEEHLTRIGRGRPGDVLDTLAH